MAKGRKTGGRRPGSQNKTTAAVKEALAQAFEDVGGVDYLKTVAREDPKTFCTLLGKLLPLQIGGDPDAPLQTVTKIELVAPHVDAED